MEEAVSIEEYALSPDPLYPFVLVPGKAYLFDDAVGANKRLDGYLYVKNMETKEIIRISNERIYPVFDDTLEYIYCITERNQIVQTDYTGSFWCVLYEAKHGDLASIWSHAGKLYFIDGEYVYSFDLTSNLATVLLTRLYNKRYI